MAEDWFGWKSDVRQHERQQSMLHLMMSIRGFVGEKYSAAKVRLESLTMTMMTMMKAAAELLRRRSTKRRCRPVR